MNRREFLKSTLLGIGAVSLPAVCLAEKEIFEHSGWIRVTWCPEDGPTYFVGGETDWEPIAEGSAPYINMDGRIEVRADGGITGE